MLKKNVLRNEKDFSRIYSRGNSQVQKYVVVFYRKNSLEYSRTAFVASKKVGNAVTRNRARRLMKESYRNMKSLKADLLKGYDVIFVARKNIADAKCRDVSISVKNALKKAKLY